MSETPQLVERYLEDRDSLTGDELELLVATLAESPDLAAELKGQLVVDELLAQKLAIDRGRFADQVEQRVRDYLLGEEELTTRAVDLRNLAERQLETSHAKVRRRQWTRVWLGVAAMIVLFAGGYAAYHYAPQWQSIARIEGVTGEAVLIRGDKQLSVAEVSRLYDGDQIKSSSNGAVRIVYHDGVRLRLGGQTAIQLSRGENPNQKQIHLHSGDITAQVTPQTHPLIIKTPVATAEVLGTEFFLSVDPETTRLEVRRGRVRLNHLTRNKSVIVAANQFGLADTHDVSLREVLWPSDRNGVTFLFQNNDQARWAMDTETDVLQSYTLASRGNAQWNADYAMRLDDGAFVTPNEAATAVLASCRATKTISWEAMITPREVNQLGPAHVISLLSDECSVSILQDEKRLILRVKHFEDVHEQVIGQLRDARPHHVACVLSEGVATCFLNGRQTSRENVPNDLFVRAGSENKSSEKYSSELLFGQAFEAAPAWAGDVEGVAIYSRTLAKEEVAKNAQYYLSAMGARPSIAEVVVEGGWNTRSHLPQTEEYAPNDSALLVAGFDIARVVSGNLVDAEFRPTGQVLVTDWAVRHGEETHDFGVGKQIRLTLQRSEDNPQLLDYFISDDFSGEENQDRPRYFVIKREELSAP